MTDRERAERYVQTIIRTVFGSSRTTCAIDIGGLEAEFAAVRAEGVESLQPAKLVQEINLLMKLTREKALEDAEAAALSVVNNAINKMPGGLANDQLQDIAVAIAAAIRGAK